MSLRGKRFIDYPRRGKEGVRRWLPSWRLWLASFLSFVLLLFGGAVAVYAAIPIPDIKASTQQQHLTVLDVNGKAIGNRGPEIRKDVPLGDVPVDVQNAMLSAEDRGFWSDGAISITGTARAALNNLSGGSTQGGSTITQQYVKNAYLSDEQTIDRKVREAVIAMKVSREMSKSQILEGYLNTVYYGRGTSGVQMAARAYFGKDVGQLTVAEGAVLASVINAPSYYETAGTDQKVTDKLKARWNYVLDGMVAMGKLSAGDRAAQQFPALKAYPQSNDAVDGQYAYLVEAAIAEATQKTGLTREQLVTGGYTIHTTFDTTMQDEAAATVKKEITDKLQPNDRDADKYVRTSIATVVPGDGAVRVLYGGYDDYSKNAFNAAWQGQIQPGSTFKAFVLAAYLAGGGKLTDTFDGNSGLSVTYNGQVYSIPNEGDADYGTVTVQQAANWSVNTAFVQMAMKVGNAQVIAAAHAAGIPASTVIPDFANTALGTMATNPLQMAAAYATFSSHGQQYTPYTVASITQAGKQIYAATKTATTAFSPAIADQVTQVLEGVVTNGSGAAAQLNDGRDVAGKTGTTDLPDGGRGSAWFAGYTTQLSTVVAVWGEKPGGALVSVDGMLGQTIGGGAVAAPLWSAYMNQAVKGTPAQSFTLTSGTDGNTPTSTMTDPATTGPTGAADGDTAPATMPPTAPTPPTSTDSPTDSSTGGTSTIDPTTPATTPPTSGTTSSTTKVPSTPTTSKAVTTTSAPDTGPPPATAHAGGLVAGLKETEPVGSPV